jgi:thiazole synthase ThiGH ThiG subunit
MRWQCVIARAATSICQFNPYNVDAGAGDPAAIAAAFAAAIAAGNQAFNAGLMEPRDMAVPSTLVIGKAVFT